MAVFLGFTIFILDFMDTIQGFKDVILLFTIPTQFEADKTG